MTPGTSTFPSMTRTLSQLRQQAHSRAAEFLFSGRGPLRRFHAEAQHQRRSLEDARPAPARAA